MAISAQHPELLEPGLKRRRSMPKVGGKHFPYTPKGKMAAKMAKKKMSSKMMMERLKKGK